MSESNIVPDLPLFADLGLEIERAADGTCRCSLPVTPRVVNPYGMLHGGISFTLADTGMGVAVVTLLTPDERAMTIECSIRYLRAASAGRIVAECRVIRRSSRLAITEAELFDETGELIAVAGGSFHILRNKTKSPQPDVSDLDADERG